MSTYSKLDLLKEKVLPLMDQIEAICDEHKIPFIFVSQPEISIDPETKQARAHMVTSGSISFDGDSVPGFEGMVIHSPVIADLVEVLEVGVLTSAKAKTVLEAMDTEALSFQARAELREAIVRALEKSGDRPSRQDFKAASDITPLSVDDTPEDPEDGFPNQELFDEIMKELTKE